ncbi:MAG: class I SAM-dependent methyltransferase [Candidatus Methylomirabilales bacterium]
MADLAWGAFLEKYGPLVTAPDGPLTWGKNLSVLLTLAARRKPARILELYTAFGHTAVALARAAPEARIFTFDVSLDLGALPAPGTQRTDRVGEMVRASDNSDVRDRIAVTIGREAELPPKVRESGPYGALFVDGNHTFPYVVRDTALALETAEEDAIIVWDDHADHFPDVPRLIALLNLATGDRIVQVGGTWTCYAHLDRELREKLLLETRKLLP